MWPDTNSNDKFLIPAEQKKLGILSKTGKTLIVLINSLNIIYQIKIK